MINRIKILSEFRALKPAQVELKPVTILVGEQGSGKTTLLKLLCCKLKAAGRIAIGTDTEAEHKSFVYDFEHDNPRMVSDLSQTHGGAEFVLSSHYLSHGETNLQILSSIEEEMREQKSPIVVILDEPDANLCPRQAILAANLAKNLAKNPNVQVIASLHNPWAIAEFGTVLSMPELTWCDSTTWLLHQISSARSKLKVRRSQETISTPEKHEHD